MQMKPASASAGYETTLLESIKNHPWNGAAIFGWLLLASCSKRGSIVLGLSTAGVAGFVAYGAASSDDYFLVDLLCRATPSFGAEFTQVYAITFTALRVGNHRSMR